MKTVEFKEIAKNYKTIFFDAFGVLKNHKGLINGIEGTFAYLDQLGIDYYVLTNDASRSPQELAMGYHSNGISSLTTEKILSSGMLAMEYLKAKIRTGTVAYLGTERSAHYIETAGLQAMPISTLNLDKQEHVDNIKCLAFLDDEGFDWNHDINKVINLLRRKNMSVVVANTDINYPVTRKDVAVAVGGLADMVEQIVGKRFIRFGKPDAQVFMFAFEMAQEVQTVRRDEILMIGDTLYTDIIGGNKFGLDTALVLSGNTLPENAKMKIRSTGIIPTYVCESVAVD